MTKSHVLLCSLFALLLTLPSLPVFAACDPTAEQTACTNIDQSYEQNGKTGRQRLENIYQKPTSVSEFGTEANRTKLFALTGLATAWSNTPIGAFSAIQTIMNGLQTNLMNLFNFPSGDDGTGANGKIRYASPFHTGGQTKKGTGKIEKDPSKTNECTKSGTDDLAQGC